MAFVTDASADRVTPARRAVRIVRWSYGRGDENLLCELGLDRRESSYELRTMVPWGSEPSIERFDDVHAAIQRQASIERLLVDEGWSLDRFETTTVVR